MKKPNPQIRWHLADAEIQEIATLRSRGLGQTAIAHKLKLTRNTIAKALRKLGLPTRRPLFHEEEILNMLRAGVERRQIARTLEVPYRSVYLFAREHGFGKPRKQLSAEATSRLRDDIINRRGPAFQLARKYGTAYKQVLKLAHETLACERFLPVHKDPLRSHFPQKHYDLVN
jgi:hypothetical protein